MKNKKLFILCLSSLFFLTYLTANAESVCSKNGYTVLTINGIFTNEKDAKGVNMVNLQKRLPLLFNNEPIAVDYVYNSTHGKGVIDVIDVITHGYLNQKSDYDLVEMLNSASSKVKTQKLLLVGHSQGNFYANNFYDKVADMEGGVPKQSIGVYSVATPAARVAGDGLYLTSDTDKVIAKLVGSAKKIMPPNTHISYANNEDIWGHDFYKIYLAHNGDRVVGDIKASLDKLKTNDIQSSSTPCLSPVKISLAHKITGAMLAVTDFSANTIINGVKQTVALAYNLSAKVAIMVGENLANIASRNLALVASSGAVGPLFSMNEQSSDNTQPSSVQTEESIESNTQENTNLDTNAPVITDTNVEETDLNHIPTDIPPVSIPTDSGVSSGGGGGGGNGGDDQMGDNSKEDKKDDKVEDKTAPVITLNGEGVINIEVGSDYVDTGATALDDVDGVVDVTSGGTVDNMKAGVYTITYAAIDKAENIATLTRTINVIAPNIKDTTAPVITLNGESAINVDVGTTYVDAGATALDDVDGVVTVVTTGVVDNTKVGIYTLTYTATDKALNASTKTRTVEVSQPAMALSFPPASMTTSGDGVYPNSAKRKIEEFFYQVVYTSKDNTPPPSSVTLRRKNLKTGLYLNDLPMNTINNNSNRVWPAELRDGNYANGELYSLSNYIDDEGEYGYYFIIVDKDSKTVKQLGENDNLKITATPATNYYPSKATFGAENGDGKNWQVWIFDHSNIYDWSDTYVNNYLHQHFKVQNHNDWSSCGSMRLDLFSSDPRNGFELGDITTGGVSEYSLESNPQCLNLATLYNVDIQWDSTGYNYTYTLASNASVVKTGHVNITNMSNNLWIGWGVYNVKIFQAMSVYAPFVESTWVGAPSQFAEGRTGGKYVYPTPSPIYKVPTEPIKSGEKLINTFDFQSLSPVVNGVVNNTNHTVNLTVPYGTNITNMIPTITVSDKSTIAPQSGVAKDFTNNVTYTVTAEDGTTQSYIVTVTVLPNPNPDDPESTPPTLRSSALNGTASNITINPVTSNLTISLRANKKVNWLSITIIKKDNEDISKLYQSDTKNCRDGENSCEKPWNKGELTHGILQNGDYKIRVRMEDTLGKIYEEYLPYIITVIGQS